uniref:EGF-like domain-containing protein n=1 Tax=Trichuris muris TaxID=70415 RepID=A0A5S6QFK3_TRIMR
MYYMRRNPNISSPEVHWYKLTDRIIEVENYDESTELFRIHRYLDHGMLHILSVQPAMHSGTFYCEVIDPSCNVYGSYAHIEVSICKWKKKGYRGYCAFGVCKVNNNSLKHITMTCTCEPGYSGAYCTYRSPLYVEQMYVPWYPFVLFLIAIVAIPFGISIFKGHSDKVRTFAKHLH